MRHIRMLRHQPRGHEMENVHWLLDAPSDDRVEDVERKNHDCRKGCFGMKNRTECVFSWIKKRKLSILYNIKWKYDVYYGKKTLVC